MAFTPLQFTKNWRNSADFPATEQSETKVREDMQYLYDEIKNYINVTLAPYFDRAIAACVKSANLPVAAANIRGCVKIGPGLKMTGDVLSLNGGESVQSDMAENDEEAATYIQNRVCYLEKEQDDLLNITVADLEFTPMSPSAGMPVAYSQAVSEDEDGRYFPLELGRKYAVFFYHDQAGQLSPKVFEEYELVAVENSQGVICLGNEQVSNPAATATAQWNLVGSVPVYIVVGETGLFVQTFGEHVDCGIMIIGADKPGKRLSAELLPEVAAVKPSWDELNPAKSAYIADKPFFCAPAKHLFSKVAVAADWTTEDSGISWVNMPYSYYGGALVPGAEYSVTWDGEDYTCVAAVERDEEGNKCVCIGDMRLLTAPDDAEMPFLVIDRGVLYFVATDGSTSMSGQPAGTHFLRFSQKEYIKTLDEKFLPSSLTSRLDSIESDIEILYALISGLQQNG